MGIKYTCGEGDSLDTWKPLGPPPPDLIVQSNWRKKQIRRNYNQAPSIDDLNKIRSFLKAKKSDAEIMRTFGITAETLVAIKKNKYHPAGGILPGAFRSSVDDHRIAVLERAIKFISEVLFIDNMAMEQFKDACGNPETLNAFIKEYDDFDEEADAKG